MACYDVGDTARLRVLFETIDLNGNRRPADPTNVKVKIRDPNKALQELIYLTDPEVVRERIGKYYVEIPVAVVGEWWHRWIGTGAVATADEEKFTVRSSEFADPT